MPTVFEVTRAVRNSDLPAPARLIMLTLASLADTETGFIPPRFSPSLSGLAKMTGLSRATVATQVNLLDDKSWLIRRSPTRTEAWRDKVSNQYTVTVPTSPGAGLVQELDHSDPSETDTTSPGAGLGLVQELDWTSPGAGLVPTFPTKDLSTTSSRPASPDDATKAEPPREDVERICAHLADRVAANGSRRPTITANWRKAARLLLDKDGRTVDQVVRAIDWCQDDEFWRGNVMSVPKLRDKYDQLRLQAQRAQATAARPARNQPFLNPDSPDAYAGYEMKGGPDAA